MTNQRLHCRILISRQKHCKIRRFSALPLSHKLVHLFHFRISLMYLKDNKLKAFSLKSVSIFKPTLNAESWELDQSGASNLSLLTDLRRNAEKPKE